MQYKNFLGYSQYKVDEEGNIYRFKFWQSGLDEFQCNEIQNKYNINQYTQQELADKFHISNQTISKIINTSKNNFWIRMKPRLNNGGYYLITLCKKQYYLHRLICEIFYGESPQGMEACHNDGNKNNNHPSNLRWDTRKNNMADKKKHGTSLGGIDKYKFKDEDILIIKYLNQFCTQKEISQIYSTTQSYINKLIHHRSI